MTSHCFSRNIRIREVYLEKHEFVSFQQLKFNIKRNGFELSSTILTKSVMFSCARNPVLFPKFRSTILTKIKILETPDWIVTESPITKHLITNYDVNHEFAHYVVSIIYSYVMPPKLSVNWG